MRDQGVAVLSATHLHASHKISYVSLAKAATLKTITACVSTVSKAVGVLLRFAARALDVVLTAVPGYAPIMGTLRLLWDLIALYWAYLRGTLGATSWSPYLLALMVGYAWCAEREPAVQVKLGELSTALKADYRTDPHVLLRGALCLGVFAVFMFVALSVEPVYILISMWPTSDEARGVSLTNPFESLAWVFFPWTPTSFDVYAWRHYPMYVPLRALHYVGGKLLWLFVALDRFVIRLLCRGILFGFTPVLQILQSLETFQYLYEMNNRPSAMQDTKMMDLNRVATATDGSSWSSWFWPSSTPTSTPSSTPASTPASPSKASLASSPPSSKPTASDKADDRSYMARLTQWWLASPPDQIQAATSHSPAPALLSPPIHMNAAQPDTSITGQLETIMVKQQERDQQLETTPYRESILTPSPVEKSDQASVTHESSWSFATVKRWWHGDSVVADRARSEGPIIDEETAPVTIEMPRRPESLTPSSASTHWRAFLT